MAADSSHMLLAIDLAMKNVETGAGGPFGAVVVKDGKVIASASNCVTATNDPTAHAEVMAIRKACQALGSFQLDGCEIYTSCEPCPMCLGAMYWARPAAVYYANTRVEAAQAGFDDAFIYDEVPFAPERRSLKMSRLTLPEAHNHFDAWIASQIQVKVLNKSKARNQTNPKSDQPGDPKPPMGQPISVPPASVQPIAQAAATGHSPSYGLKEHSLSPIETLAQSISTMAPTTSPTMTIPLVFALAGNGTWLSYLFATIGVLLVALCISRFARYSSSPGSLYAFAASAFRSKTAEPRSTYWGLVSAWSLLFAYIATGASVTGGFINYSNVLLFANFGHRASPTLLAAIAILGASAIAYRDVKVSAQFMLWIEAVSVTMILIVIGLIFWKYGFHLDPDQWRLKGATGSGIRLGVVLALFSFVGFESASSLGSEARDPLRTIPRALIQSAVLSGCFFLIATYTEVLGFHSSPQSFGDSPAPMRFLAAQVGTPFLGPLIDVGAVVSMFACTLACITASARVLLLMSHHGLAHKRLSRTHAHNATPGAAVMLIGFLMLLATAALTIRGVSGSDIYGWMGSLATYGFITVYGQVTFALPFYLKLKQRLTAPLLLLSIVATTAMVLALVGTLYPVPAAPYNWLPYLYLSYLFAGLVWFAASRRVEANRLLRKH